MKNSLNDLNSYLFDELDRLSNEDLKGETLQEEISRAKAISDIAETAVSNATLVLKAEALKYECQGKTFNMPKMLCEDNGA